MVDGSFGFSEFIAWWEWEWDFRRALDKDFSQWVLSLQSIIL
jgi:hypothetical protein